MTIGIVNGFDRIAYRQALGIGLTVRPVICAGNYIEVTRLMDERASLGVGAGCRGGPEDTAQVDGVGLIGVNVGIVFLFATAIKGHGSRVQRIADG